MDRIETYNSAADFLTLPPVQAGQLFDVEEMLNSIRASDHEPPPASPEHQLLRAPTLQSNRARLGLLDVPPEIRLRIYEMVLQDETRVPPPITRVSRCIREESLEVWYETARFPVRFKIVGWFDGQITPSYRIADTEPVINIKSGTESVLHHTQWRHCYCVDAAVPPSVYPLLRKVLLYVQGHPEDCFLLDLDAKSNSYSIRHAPRDAGGHPIQSTKRIEHLLRHLDNAMAEIMVESGGVGNISFWHYAKLTPRPSWKFWEDVP